MFPIDFCWVSYLFYNPDVKAASNTQTYALYHWLEYGIYENRKYRDPDYDLRLFDYHEYLRSYPDLQAHGINTEQGAIEHFLEHGKREGRNFPLRVLPFRRKILIDLNGLQPFTGLVNQLIALVNGITMGAIYNRDVVVHGFYPNYHSRQIIPLSQVIDLPKLNNLLQERKLEIKVDDNLPTQKWYFFNIAQYYGSEHFLGSIGQHLPPDRDVNMGLSFHFEFYHSPSPIFKDFFLSLYHTLPYNERYYQLAQKYRQTLNLHDYNVLHLRLEDDMLKFLNKGIIPDSISEIQDYMIKIIRERFPVDEPLYVATGLGKYPNQCNTIMKTLGEIYPQLKISSLEEIKNEGRELTALVEYLICREGKKFTGHYNSTFSQLLDNFYSTQGKSTGLYHIPI